jgi:hypothetical protein
MNGPDPNHHEQSLTPCNDKGLTNDENRDPPEGYCEGRPSLRHVPETQESWLDDAMTKKLGLGFNKLCDPVQTGQIINDNEKTNPNVLYRYSKAIRSCDEAVMDLFRNLVIIDEDGVAKAVPIIWATQERAVAHAIQENVSKDVNNVVNRIKLPMLAISSTDFSFNQDRYTYHRAIDWLRQNGRPGFESREKYDHGTVMGVSRGIPVDVGYTLIAWTMYVEDMNQILEQVMTKFSPVAYISVRGVRWETIVKLTGIANNLETEPGDNQLRVVKFQFNLSAETYIPQPISREKTVLKIKTDFVDGVSKDSITRVIDRLETAVNELECDG